MAQKFTIKKLTIISGTGIKSYELGVDGVNEIRDCSLEYENSINFIYYVFVESVQKYTVVNCPVVIEYDDSI